MKIIGQSKKYVTGFQDLVIRFPLTISLLLVMTIDSLTTQGFLFGNQTVQLTLGITALLSAIAELLYERFYNQNKTKRIILNGIGVIFGLLYYLYLHFSTDLNSNWPIYSIPGIRSMILFFTLAIVFIWIPSLKSTLTFEESFLAVFKAFFISLFFSVVLYLGIMFTFILFEMLIAPAGDNWYTYSSVLVFNFFWPVFFLYLIPDYKENKSSSYVFETPKLLSHLVSWILVPVMVLYSAIILLYIFTNLGGDFFNDSLLEPLLLSYAISGWILLILSAGIDRLIVKGFKRFFPILLLLVIVFQMIASTIQIGEVGMTHGRYLILLFGLASIICGVFYILKRQKLELLPLVATIAGMIALVPPIDALSLSVSNQVSRLESALERNNMLENDEVVKQDSVPKEDQEEILSSANYLIEINALDRVSFIPDDFQNSSYSNVYTLFGFDPDDNHYGYGMNPSWITVSDWNQGKTIIPLEDYNQLIPLYLSSDMRRLEVSLNSNQETYLLEIGKELLIKIENESEEVIGEMDFSYLLDQWDIGEQEELSLAEATFEEVGETFKAKIILRELSQYENGEYYSDVYLLIGTIEE